MVESPKFSTTYGHMRWTVIILQEKMLQFTRAIRKIALSALSAASNASVRRNALFAHEMALPSHIHAGRFPCEHEICPQEYACEL